MKLNARKVDTVKLKDKPYKLSDGGGLYSSLIHLYVSSSKHMRDIL
jgi:hypothetical protein